MPTKGKTTETAPSAEKRRAPQPDDKRPGEREQGVHPAIALQRAKVLPASALKANDILALQRTIGNRAVQHLLSAQDAEPLSSPLSSARSAPPPIQAKLMVGPAGDHYEQEADRMARQVTSEPTAQHGAEAVQRQTDEDEPVQRKPLAAPIASVSQSSPGGELAAIEPEARAAIQRAHGGGQPLPNVARARIERTFGADFGSVRVHTDATADQLNRSLQSRAFTTGQDLFFKRGEYNPDSTAGRELIAHELAHVMQQSSPQTQNHSIQRKVITAGEDQGPVGETHPDWVKYKRTPPAPEMIKDPYAPYTRAEIISRVKEVENEKRWLVEEATTLRDNRLRAERVEKQWEAYRKAFSYWEEDGLSHSKTGVDATKKQFIDEKKKWESVEAVEARLAVVHKGKSAELKPYQEILDSLPWRETYATKEQKDEIKVLRDDMKPRVDADKKRLADVAKSKAELEKVRLSESKEKLTTAGERIRLVVENNQSRTPRLYQARQGLRRLVKKLDKAILAQLKEMLNKARDEKKLDLGEEQVEAIAKRMIAAKAPKREFDERADSAEKRIKDAVTLQHNPTRALWYGELGLAGDNPAMAEDGQIAGDPVHQTLYKQMAFPDSGSKKDLGRIALDDLKKDLLGSGVFGFHVTIDQKNGSANHPHAFRGGPVRMNNYILRPPTTWQQAQTRLIEKRDASVTAAENTIKHYHENKGKGMNRVHVQEVLKGE